MTHHRAATATTGSPGRYTVICLGLRDIRPAVPAGGLVALFLDAPGRVVVRVVLDEGTRHVDELFLRHLTALVAEIGAASVLLASIRPDGQPQRPDRILWREMQRRLAGGHSELADLLVVGDDRCWSAATRRRIRYDADQGACARTPGRAVLAPPPGAAPGAPAG